MTYRSHKRETTCSTYHQCNTCYHKEKSPRKEPCNYCRDIWRQSLCYYEPTETKNLGGINPENNKVV
jgi:hypothetical protein